MGNRIVLLRLKATYISIELLHNTIYNNLINGHVYAARDNKKLLHKLQAKIIMLNSEVV